MSNVKKVIELLGELKPELESLGENLSYPNIEDQFLVENLIWETISNTINLERFLEV